MKDKVYEYDGKLYCEEDLSMEVGDKYGGSLFDLYWDASHGSESGSLCDETVYYSAYNPEVTYDNCEELVEDYFEESEVTDLEAWLDENG